MIYLIYASSSVRMMSDEELLQILEKSRENNAKLGVTGMLLYKGGNFLQVLEGEEAAVMATYDKIVQDSRHHGLMIFVKRPLEKRQFENWEMAFYNLNKINPDEVPGYSKYLTEALDSESFAENPSVAHKFLEIFKENMR
jgi:hypothetical protein